jgi:hypothetical protein
LREGNTLGVIMGNISMYETCKVYNIKPLDAPPKTK